MKSILIIDDSATLRQFLKIALEANGYSVWEASNGKLGYDLYKQYLPDCVITDIIMPDMDGLELICKLLNEYPKIKIIVISDGGSIAGVPYFEICMKIGVSNFLKKPIQKEALLNMLEKFD